MCNCSTPYDEEAKKYGVPVIGPVKPWLPKQPIDPNGVVAICGQCGLKLHRVMGYCCPRTNCPCGLGSPVSMIAPDAKNARLSFYPGKVS